jgi:hypothetical protein
MGLVIIVVGTGTAGPGRGSVNRLILPRRSSVAIWCTLAVE